MSELCAVCCVLYTALLGRPKVDARSEVSANCGMPVAQTAD